MNADEYAAMSHLRISMIWLLLVAGATLASCASGGSGGAGGTYSGSSGGAYSSATWKSEGRDGHATATYSRDRALGVGDPAPILAGVRWLKGEPVRYWKPGQVYVLDFWATWCAPCVGGFPHMSDLQRRYASRGVTVIGVAVSPQPRAMSVEEFVRTRRSEIGFSIAEDVEVHAHRAFLGAAGLAGIPTVMVIDARGRLAWMGTGSPMPGLDEAVERAAADARAMGVAAAR